MKAPLPLAGVPEGSGGALVDAPASERPHSLTIVYGPPAAGKTTLVSAWVRGALSEGRRVAILSPVKDARVWPVPCEWPGRRPVKHPDYPGMRMTASDAWLLQKKAEGFQGVLVFDDADAYLTAGATWLWHDFFATFRHWNVDAIFVSKRPQGIPREVDDNASTMVIFAIRNQRTVKAIAEKLQDPEVLDDMPREPFKFLQIDMVTGQSYRGKVTRGT